MNIGVQHTVTLEQVMRQIDAGEYRGALSTYREFREALVERRYEPDRIRTLDDAERAARDSFRSGTVSFESELYTLVFVARRLVREAEP